MTLTQIVPETVRSTLARDLPVPPRTITGWLTVEGRRGVVLRVLPVVPFLVAVTLLIIAVRVTS